ncbi:MAG: DUF512 domain-containing protein [Clostridia bacterium]|nr:DUF512 domain-containing protein [Clostridia bacterium]
MVTITDVLPGSRAAAAGVCAGDILLSINGHEIRDVLDYRFYLTERRVTLALHRGPELLDVTIRKGEYDDIGLEFSTPLMDGKHCCANRCIFCFIDQLPKGMRDSLYFKDDDSRLSFLHGNYITLTNLGDRDIDRIIEMHISPVNVSVHTTNPELRCSMMGNKRAGKTLDYLRRLADAGIAICGQIVLCRGINDGVELDRSMRDLAELMPALRSVSIVPAGLTKYREGLYPLSPFTPEEAAAVIAQVDAFAEGCKAKYDTRLFFCADEFYLKAGLPLPDHAYYEEYSQIENGVGLLTSLCHEFDFELDYVDDLLPEAKLPRTVTVATGEAAYGTLSALAERLMAKVPGLTVQVIAVHNDFFGDLITVAGLLTGRDLAAQLKGHDLGDELLLPSVTLRAEGDLFLCGMTPDALADELETPIKFVKNDGAALIAALLGVESPYC